MPSKGGDEERFVSASKDETRRVELSRAFEDEISYMAKSVHSVKTYPLNPETFPKVKERQAFFCKLITTVVVILSLRRVKADKVVTLR